MSDCHPLTVRRISPMWIRNFEETERRITLSIEPSIRFIAIESIMLFAFPKLYSEFRHSAHFSDRHPLIVGRISKFRRIRVGRSQDSSSDRVVKSRPPPPFNSRARMKSRVHARRRFVSGSRPRVIPVVTNLQDRRITQRYANP